MIEKIIFRDDFILVEKNKNVFKLSGYFIELSNEILNINMTQVCKLTHIKNCFCIQDLFFEKNSELFAKVINSIKNQFDLADSVNICIETGAVIEYRDEMLKKYNVSVKKLNFISGYDNIINEFKLYSRDKLQQEIYKILQVQVSDYLIQKYRKEFDDLYAYEIVRVKCVIKKVIYALISQCTYNQSVGLDTKLRENEEFKISIPVIDNNNKRRYIDICITLNEVNKLPIIMDISSKSITNILKYKSQIQFKVVFSGIFTGGKSSLINALVGESILKTDVRAETASVCKIAYSDEKNICIQKEKSKDLILIYEKEEELKNTLESITSVREDGNNVKEVIIGYKNDEFKNITLIDSPGMFSRHSTHDDISKKAIYDSNMVVFTIDPLKIGDKNFTDVLKESISTLASCNKRFCFVLTKLDRYEEEYEKLLKEFNYVLEELDIKNVPVFFISAYFASKSQMFKKNKISIDEIRKDRNLYVIEDGDVLSGRLLNESHVESIHNFSRINELKEYINEVRERYEWQI